MKKHLGVKFNWIIYSNRRNLTQDEVIDYLIECIERKGWWAGGGSEEIDLNKEPKKNKA